MRTGCPACENLLCVGLFSAFFLFRGTGRKNGSMRELGASHSPTSIAIARLMPLPHHDLVTLRNQFAANVSTDSTYKI
jgi:hypothetical protein